MGTNPTSTETTDTETTGAGHVGRVRAAYSARSREYIDRLGDMEAMHPADITLITDWAAGLNGWVLDVGCGPGHWTAYLHDAFQRSQRGRSSAVKISGVEIVPEFLANCRERYPEVDTWSAPAHDLGIAQGSLGGILAWYSLIHTPPERLESAFAEFARVMRPGGSLLMGFFDGPAGRTFEHAVTTGYLWSVTYITRRLEPHGFRLQGSVIRRESDHRTHGALIVRRVLTPEVHPLE